MEVAAVRHIKNELDDTSSLPEPVSRATTPLSQPLSEVLAALGDRVAPISMARERTLPVSEDCAALFGEGALVRGRVLSCVGAAATSLALGLIAPAVAAGSWVAVIDVPTLGLDAANELGLPLERVVAISTVRDVETNARKNDAGKDGAGKDGAGKRWADVVAAAADGFEVMIVQVPDDVRSATVRRVATRLQQRGVVMIVLGDPGPLVCDGVLDASGQSWSGLGNGWGHLRQRSVEVTATGRRLPGRRCQTMLFPPAGQVAVRDAATVHAATVQPAPTVRHETVAVAQLSTAS